MWLPTKLVIIIKGNFHRYSTCPTWYEIQLTNSAQCQHCLSNHTRTHLNNLQGTSCKTELHSAHLDVHWSQLRRLWREDRDLGSCYNTTMIPCDASLILWKMLFNTEVTYPFTSFSIISTSFLVHFFISVISLTTSLETTCRRIIVSVVSLKF